MALADRRRRQYATYQPVFWRPAADAVDRHRTYLAGLITDDNVIFRVAETGDGLTGYVLTGYVLTGFVLAQLVPAPPVYDPGGLTCSIDDFAVMHSDLWASVGVDLLREVQVEAARRGAAQVVVVCGHEDDAKRAALNSCGLAIASEWWVATLSRARDALGGFPTPV